MIITCKECGTDFNLDESLLNESDSKVQCTKCKNIFVASPSAKQTDEPAETVAKNKDKEDAQEIQPQKENEDPSGSNEKLSPVEENAEPKIEYLELDLDIKGSEVDTNSKETEPGIEIDSDNLHLSDIENIEPYKEVADNENQTDLKDLDLNLELDLDLGLGLEPDEHVAKPDTLLKGQKKELQDDDIDLSDLEIISDECEISTDQKSKTDIEDLELELDMELNPDDDMTESDSPAEQEKDEIAEDDIDLSDLEIIFDECEEATDQKGKADIENLELERNMELNPDDDMTESDSSAEQKKDEITEDNLDLSDLEIRFDEKSDDANASVESKDRDLEPEPALEPESEQFSDKEQRPQEYEFSQPGLEALEKIEKSDAHIKEEPVFDNQTQTDKKKTTGILFYVLMIAVLLAGGAYGAFTFIKPVNAFFSNLFNTETQVQKDAEEIKINPIKESINGKFVENTKAGSLFVITGRVKNESDQTGGFIRITGNLFTKGDILAKTKRVYCGNELSDIDLANMDPAEINKRLLNPYGDNKINAEIKPGNDIPFMIVFFNLPDELVNFTIEVEKPSKKIN